MRWLFSQGLSGRKVIWSCPVEHEDSWEAWQPEALVRNSRNDTNPSLQFPTTISLSMVTIGSFIKNNFTYFSLLGLCCCMDFSLWCSGFSVGWLLLLWSTGSIVMTHGLCCSVACGSSHIRDRTCVSCISR